MSKVEEGSTPSGIDALLEDASVDDFPFTRSVVTLDGATNLEDAFRVLAKNSISSVPIKHEGTWVGFVDISDLVQHVAELYRTLQAAETARNFTSLKALLTEESRLMPKPVESCVNISKNNPFLPVAPGSSLKDVLLRLAKRQDGAQVHRVPVVDPKTGEITKIVSQSTAIRFLYTVRRTVWVWVWMWVWVWVWVGVTGVTGGLGWAHAWWTSHTTDSLTCGVFHVTGSTSTRWAAWQTPHWSRWASPASPS